MTYFYLLYLKICTITLVKTKVYIMHSNCQGEYTITQRKNAAEKKTRDMSQHPKTVTFTP